MLIRRPVVEVFKAFVDPAITTRFWFTKSSGRLEPGRQIRWDWEMYGVHALVDVKAIEPQHRILIEWDNPPCPVEWLFVPHEDNTTLVSITNQGFHGSDDEAVAQAIDAIRRAGGLAVLAHPVHLRLDPAKQMPERRSYDW